MAQRRSGSMFYLGLAAFLGVAAFLLIGCPIAPAVVQGLIDLPKTGQTVSYAAGDDGDLEKGVAWPSPRFIDNGNGTVTDDLTGLMWDQIGNRYSELNWTTVLSGMNGLTIDVHADWRMPNVHELRSLVNYGEADHVTWLNSLGFTSVQSSLYFTSTTYAPLTTYVWGVRMSEGTGYSIAKNGLTLLPGLAVRGQSTGGAVQLHRTGQTSTYATGDDGDLRTGVAWPSPRFIVNDDGTITDALTGLIWDQNANRINDTWANALASANALTLAGHADWRVPNVVEMLSLIDRGQISNATWLATKGFTNVQAGYYLTSTTDASDTNSAWGVATDDGDNPQPRPKDTSYPVIAVRGPETP